MEGDRATPREDPHSLAPVQIEIAGIDEDIAQLKRGRVPRLVVAALCSGLAVFGIVQWMDHIDGTQAYAAAADRLELINTQHGNAFLRCVLPDLQRSHLASRQALHTAFEVASDRFQKHYGKQLKYCSGMSEQLAQQLNDLDVPTDMNHRVQRLRAAASELNQAFVSYRKYLQDPSRPYDFVQATPMIERVAIAWSTYDEHRTSINQALRVRQ